MALQSTFFSIGGRFTLPEAYAHRIENALLHISMQCSPGIVGQGTDRKHDSLDVVWVWLEQILVSIGQEK
jgi:hypothetical protein